MRPSGDRELEQIIRRFIQKLIEETMEDEIEEKSPFEKDTSRKFKKLHPFKVRKRKNFL